ncbi:MAG: ABC transporter permease subunit [Vicinamibacteria bacterium]|jgi:iron(III) transport system permease protein|nr:ABC transporter permease subunit [Vicinamibacteria bacterium]
MGLLARTVGLACLATALALALGFGTAVYLVTRSDSRLAAIVGRVYLLPLLIPPYVYAASWLAFFRPDGPIGSFLSTTLGIRSSMSGLFPTVVLMGASLAPIAVFLTRQGCASLPRDLIDAARTTSAAVLIWRRILLPLLRPALLTAAGIVFVLSLTEYAIPALLECTVYAREIYAEFGQGGDARAAFVLAWPLVITAVFVLAITERGVWITPSRPESERLAHIERDVIPIGLRVWSWVAVCCQAAAVVVPLAMLITELRLAESTAALQGAASDATATLAIACAAALLAALLAWPLAARVTAHPTRAALLLILLPLAWPAPLIGIAWIPWLAPLPSSIANVVLAQVGRLLPLAVLALLVSLQGRDPLLRMAARAAPVGALRALVKIHLPLALDGLLTAAGLVFMLSLGEIGATLLVIPPGSQTLALRLFNWLHYGSSASVAALALMGLALSALVGLGVVILAQDGR